MQFSGQQTIYSCEEHEQVGISVSELMEDGGLAIYPEVVGQGYFDINYRRGELVVRASRFVGLIPLSDRIAIHVRPKVPIKNLVWMAWRAGGSARWVEGFVRGYELQTLAVSTPENLYLEVFLAALRRALGKGILKEYETRETEQEFRGALAISRSVERFYSQGIRYRHAFDVTDLSIDNLPNRILKHTILRLLRHVEHDRGGPGEEISRSARQLLLTLESVDDTRVTRDLIVRRVPGILRGLRTTYAHYEAPLWLAFLIASNSGISLERVGQARFESIIVDVSRLFEDFVRAVLTDAEAEMGFDVINGNEAPFSLFAQGRQFQAAPDYYFMKGGQVSAIADAKYKDHPARGDRYELLSHCEAAGVKRAAFVCPVIDDSPAVEAYGTTRGGIDVQLIRVDLGADDLGAAERRLVAHMKNFLKAARQGAEGQ